MSEMPVVAPSQSRPIANYGLQNLPDPATRNELLATYSNLIAYQRLIRGESVFHYRRDDDLSILDELPPALIAASLLGRLSQWRVFGGDGFFVRGYHRTVAEAAIIAGKTLSHSGQYERAVAAYEKAIRFTRDPKRLKTAWSLIAHTYGRWALEYEQRHQAEALIKWYEASNAWAEVEGRDGLNARAARENIALSRLEHQREIIDRFEKDGDRSIVNGRFAEAAAHYQRGLEWINMLIVEPGLEHDAISPMGRALGDKAHFAIELDGNYTAPPAWIITPMAIERIRQLTTGLDFKGNTSAQFIQYALDRLPVHHVGITRRTLSFMLEGGVEQEAVTDAEIDVLSALLKKRFVVDPSHVAAFGAVKAAIGECEQRLKYFAGSDSGHEGKRMHDEIDPAKLLELTRGTGFNGGGPRAWQVFVEGQLTAEELRKLETTLTREGIKGEDRIAITARLLRAMDGQPARDLTGTLDAAIAKTNGRPVVADGDTDGKPGREGEKRSPSGRVLGRIPMKR